MGKGGLILAWLAGLGIIAWRDIAKNHAPPVPGQLLGASGLFALLAVIAEYTPASQAATLAAWGFDIAALMNVLPQGLGGLPASGNAGAAAPTPKGPHNPPAKAAVA
jgi:hypothetical protein